MPLPTLLSLTGRLNRRPYLIIGLVQLATFLAAAFAAIATLFTLTPNPILENRPLQAALALAALLFLWIALAALVRRLHDLNLPGLHALWIIPAQTALAYATSRAGAGILAVLILGGLATLIILGAIPGTQGPNRYGPPPAGPPPRR